ncbi:pseudouridine synthase [Legionella israelensis]|uniref:Pseudouridine synthase n=1 Tax=Legionella israelensis TaxID=454 RepID=A0A0W0WS25_9GAMM|nr:pseudouridine synthase [Legionella israelensis]KTD35131.1 23S rRNA pseudouridine synthase [Legionella israelensis]QBS08712.1 pseudouridine synthase [Legionella israelensis]SCY01357.1 23S rRNA pseudouridine2457 synthase [Legionella israelensis DSM 19235]STX58384.1 23S rRNA pseudouridine synthase [Legionella israelensis]
MNKLLLFNKPYGVLSQFSGMESDKTLAGYIDLPDFYPAGRLDKNSEGLLLLTNDGRLQHQLSHPKFHKRKYYWVQVEGQLHNQALEPLRSGLSYKELLFLPAQCRIIEEPKIWPRTPPIRYRASIPTSWLEIILTEGKNHQIRKMTAAIGFPTLRLIRHRIGQWTLANLQPGEYRWA